MRTDKNRGLITALLLSTLITLGGILCLTSGFRLNGTNLFLVILPAILCCGVYLLLSRYQWGTMIFTGLFLLILGFLLTQTRLLTSVEALLYRITVYYDRGYGWGHVNWSGADLTHVSTAGGLALVATLVALSVCRCIRRRRWVGFGLLAGLLPLFACCVVTDTVPGMGGLWLLLTSLLVFTLTHLSRRENTKNANRLVALLLVPVVLSSSLLFLFSSPDNYEEQLQGFQDTMDQMLSSVLDLFPDLGLGIGDTIGLVNNPTDLDLTKVGPSKQKSQVVMVVDTSLLGSFYLRGRSYDTYTGTDWEATLNTAGENGWPTAGLSPSSTVIVKTYFSANLQYFPYYVRSEGWTSQLENGAIVNPDRSREYQFELMRPNSKPSAKFDPLTPAEQKAYTDLPQSTKAAAQQILQGLWAQVNPTDKYLTDDQKANFIARYVSFSAQYDLNTEKMPQGEGDFAIWFLEEGNTGYCTHFATAAAVLLRAAGIPARYVTGYRADMTNTSQVTSDQAHAWVEYLHPSYGWTVLDATPGMNSYAPFGSEPTEPTTQPTEPPTTQPTESSDPTQTTGPTQSTSPTQSTQPTGTRPTGQTDPTESTEDPGLTDPVKKWNLKWIKYILWILAVWALLAGQDKLRKDHRRKRMTQGEPNRQALARWRYCKLLARLTGLSAAPLLPLAEKATFSQHSLTGEELAEFDSWIKKATALLDQKNFFVRMLIYFVYAIQ